MHRYSKNKESGTVPNCPVWSVLNHTRGKPAQFHPLNPRKLARVGEREKERKGGRERGGRGGAFKPPSLQLVAENRDPPSLSLYVFIYLFILKFQAFGLSMAGF